MKKVSFFLLLTLILILYSTNQVHAQTPNPSTPTDDQVNAIAKQLYCPVCENIPLDVCGTQACEQWRELIRLKITEGWNEKQIKDYFVAQYGDRVLATPPASGLNWLVYIVPPLIIRISAFIFYKSLLAWKKPSQAIVEKSQSAKPDDIYIKKVEEEILKNDHV